MTFRRAVIACGVLGVLLALVVGSMAFLLVHRVHGDSFDSNGVPIHFTVEGQGEPIILIHGVAANADLNWRIPGVIRALSRDFQVIAFDLRGHGLSGQPTDPAQYGDEIYEDIARLMDHLGIEKAHIAGYSLGGFITLKFITAHPERVHSAAICAAGWIDPANPVEVPNPYRAPEPPEPMLQDQQASVMPFAASKSVFHRVRSAIGDRIMNPVAKKALKKTYTALAVSQAELERNAVPAVCFMGDQDGFLYLGRSLRDHMADLQYVEIPGASHFTAPFYPSFKRDLHDFFAKQRADTANEPSTPKEAML